MLLTKKSRKNLLYLYLRVRVFCLTNTNRVLVLGVLERKGQDQMAVTLTTRGYFPATARRADRLYQRALHRGPGLDHGTVRTAAALRYGDRAARYVAYLAAALHGADYSEGYRDMQADAHRYATARTS